MCALTLTHITFLRQHVLDRRGRGRLYCHIKNMSNDVTLWLKRNGVSWDGLCIARAPVTMRGMIVVSECAWEKGDILARIPKAAVLSVQTASCAPILLDLISSKELAPAAALNVAVAHEYSLGAASQWFGYLSSLPEFEPLPMLWSDSELRQLLGGTGLDVEARQRRLELLAEHRESVAVLRRKSDLVDAGAFDLATYLRAASLTSSRAFFVDDCHGEALVPFADLLNHKCALVPDDAVIEGGVDEGSDDSSAAAADDDDDDDVDGGDGGGQVDSSFAEVRVVDAARREAVCRAASAFGVNIEMDTTLPISAMGGARVQVAAALATTRAAARPRAATISTTTMLESRRRRRTFSVATWHLWRSALWRSTRRCLTHTVSIATACCWPTTASRCRAILSTSPSYHGVLFVRQQPEVSEEANVRCARGSGFCAVRRARHVCKS
jgi:hypothetical protein